jgi:hypothetical protein
LTIVFSEYFEMTKKCGDGWEGERQGGRRGREGEQRIGGRAGRKKVDRVTEERRKRTEGRQGRKSWRFKEDRA